MDNRPLVLLDFDGCLNPDSIPSPDFVANGAYDDFVEHKITIKYSGGYRERYKVFISQKQVNDLKSLGVDICWLTSWLRVGVNRIEAIFGYPGFSTVFHYLDHLDLRPKMFEEFNEYKLAVFEELSKIRPIIWIDDEAISLYRSKNNILEKKNSDKHLYIEPDSAIGITSNHINNIKYYLSSFQ